MHPVIEHAAPIGVGVIGLGRAGCWHLERLRLSEVFSVIAGCDECCEAASRAAELAPTIADCRQLLLDDPRIELVVLATPPATHATLALEALASGKHVLVETPCGLSTVEIDALIEAEERSGRSVIVAHQRRWDDDFRMARDCLASGAIGRPTRIKFEHWQYSLPLPTAAGDDRSLGGTNEVSGLDPSHWRDENTTGGGALWEFGVHLLDQLLVLARDLPLSVYARTEQDAKRAVDTGFLALVTFASGLDAHIEVNRGVAATLETGWVIAASLGSYARETRFTVTEEGEIIDLPLSSTSLPQDDFLSAVARHLRNGAPNPVPLTEARMAIELVEAARRSAKTGQPVVLAELRRRSPDCQRLAE